MSLLDVISRARRNFEEELPDRKQSKIEYPKYVGVYYRQIRDRQTKNIKYEFIFIGSKSGVFPINFVNPDFLNAKYELNTIRKLPKSICGYLAIDTSIIGNLSLEKNLLSESFQYSSYAPINGIIGIKDSTVDQLIVKKGKALGSYLEILALVSLSKLLNNSSFLIRSSSKPSSQRIKQLQKIGIPINTDIFYADWMKMHASAVKKRLSSFKLPTFQ
jgi:hypothetical protein